MKEQTIYESEDGRRFETADECLEWERTLTQLRKIRQKLWEAQVNKMRTVDMYGEDHIRQEMGMECTDDFDLYFSGTGDLEIELCQWFGDLNRVVPAKALAQLDKIKRSYDYAFGD